MKFRIRLYFFIACTFLFCQKTFSQCFEIEGILVAACTPPGPVTEGFNEMVRFRVGAANINTATLTVNWPSNAWQGVVQNATTASKVAALNSQITAANGCGQILQPVGGILPANAEVILVTSYNFDTTSNGFGALDHNIYIIFQDNATTTSGHFANYNIAPGLRTLTMSFGGACTDAVTYDRTQLSNASGATVNFTPTGVATYVNHGCVAPVDVLDAGTTLTACPGATIALAGAANGFTNVGWTAPDGTFSAPSSLTSNYTLSAAASGTVILTLTGTNACNLLVTDTVTVNVTPGTVPTFNAVAPICTGATLAALPTTSTNGITGSWAPAINNSITTVYTFTPNAGQCATATTLTVTVNPVSILNITNNNAICNPNQLNWAVWNTIGTNTATGTVGSISVNVTHSGGGMSDNPGGMHPGVTFPPQYDVPTATSTIRNEAAGIFTACFNVPVTNPQVAFASIGSPTQPVQVNTSIPYVVTWQGTAMNYVSNQSFIGTEGFTIITFPGTYSCITFDYLASENYCTLAFGIQDTDCQISPICQGDSVTLVAHGATNYTWSPATGLNTTTGSTVIATPAITTTYFVTSPDNCTTGSKITVNVNPTVTPIFNAVTPICTGATLAVLPTTSTNGITGVWSPALNNTATTLYTFTPTSGQCAVTATMSITVNAASIIPTFNAVAPICTGAVLAALPTTSINGIIGVWSPAINNTATTLYTFTPNANQCAVTTTLSITVNPPSIIPTFNAVTPICSGAVLAALPTTSTNGIIGVWSPAINNTATTLYTFTPNANQCAVTTTLSITVNPPSIIPTFNAVAPICTGAVLAALPTTSTNGITGVWSPAINNTATTLYTFTPNAGQCALQTTKTITVNPLITPTFNAIPPICSGSILFPLPTTSTNGINGTWSPVLNNTVTTIYTFTPNGGQCAATAPLTITIIQPTVPTFNAVAPICSGATLSALPTTSTNGITGVWSPALNNTTTTLYTFTPDIPQCATTKTLTITVNPKVTPTFNPVATICTGASLGSLATISNNGIAGTWSPALNNTATTVYTFTPNATECAFPTTLTITVNQKIIPAFNPVAPICQGTALSTLPTTSTNGITGTWSPALNNMATTIYTFTPAIGSCATTATLMITVTPPVIIPTFAPVAQICSGSTLAPLPTTSINGIVGSWSPALDNTISINYTFTPNPGQCALPTTLYINVIPPVVPHFNPGSIPREICSGAIIAPLPTISIEGITGTWSPAINNTVSTTYTFTPAAGQCAVINALSINVANSVIRNESNIICLNTNGQAVSPPVIDSGLSASDYIFVWTLDSTTLFSETGATLQTTVPGIYTVVATNLTTACTLTIITDVKASSPAVAVATVGDDFDDSQQIVVTVTGGLGEYEYQLNNGAFQSSNTFWVSQSGEYTIHVRDNIGCNNIELLVDVINYPRFFTPNGDGYNDFWNVWNLPNPANSVIYIFDRYGKLLKEISAAGSGWDGHYNDHELPSTDYWFKLLYEDKSGIKKEFKAHFSLKR